MRGVEPVDPTDLRPRVDTYTGGTAGPSWHPDYIALDGSEILVVVIDPPKQGDRIWALRRESPPLGKKGTVPDGAVFHRSHGATERARAAEMDMLQKRLLEANQVPKHLTVSVEGHIPWLSESAAVDAVEGWVEEMRKKQMRTEAPAMSFDYRSGEKYAAEVDAWVEELRGWAIETVLRFAAGDGQVVRLSNSGNRYLPGIEFELEVGGLSGLAWDDEPQISDPPTPPKQFGSLYPAPIVFPALDLSGLENPLAGAIGTRVEPDPLRILDSCGDLAATRTYTTDRVFMLLLDDAPPDTITASWTASCRGMDGILQGSVEIEVSEVTVGALLDDAVASFA